MTLMLFMYKIIPRCTYKLINSVLVELVHMYILQVLKYSIRQERLSFTDDWLTSDAALASLDVSQEDIDRLMTEGKINEVLSLVEEAQQVVEAESFLGTVE